MFAQDEGFGKYGDCTEDYRLTLPREKIGSVYAERIFIGRINMLKLLSSGSADFIVSIPEKGPDRINVRCDTDYFGDFFVGNRYVSLKEMPSGNLK